MLRFLMERHQWSVISLCGAATTWTASDSNDERVVVIFCLVSHAQKRGSGACSSENNDVLLLQGAPHELVEPLPS
jgi:hypothetical protein